MNTPCRSGPSAQHTPVQPCGWASWRNQQEANTALKEGEAAPAPLEIHFIPDCFAAPSGQLPWELTAGRCLFIFSWNFVKRKPSPPSDFLSWLDKYWGFQNNLGAASDLSVNLILSLWNLHKDSGGSSSHHKAQWTVRFIPGSLESWLHILIKNWN